MNAKLAYKPLSTAAIALIGAIDRAEQVIDRESALLVENRPIDMHDFNIRKSQCLLEISRAIRGLGDGPQAEALRQRLTVFRRKVEENRRLLETHLGAMREVVGIVSTAIEASHSDGTYSARPVRREWSL